MEDNSSLINLDNANAKYFNSDVPASLSVKDEIFKNVQETTKYLRL